MSHVGISLPSYHSKFLKLLSQKIKVGGSFCGWSAAFQISSQSLFTKLLQIRDFSLHKGHLYSSQNCIFIPKDCTIRLGVQCLVHQREGRRHGLIHVHSLLEIQSALVFCKHAHRYQAEDYRYVSACKLLGGWWSYLAQTFKHKSHFAQNTMCKCVL